MWPVLLDMTKEESMQSLRNLELEAYAHLVSALRAQGPLDPDKRKLLKDTGLALNITQDRHKAEVRRAINDEKLNTIAYHVTGVTESIEDWAQEGRRVVPLIPRMAPHTAFSALADEAADGANLNNKQMPLPAATERKRPPPQPNMLMPENSKTIPFRIPELPKADEGKKRKLPICTENSSLAQHLLSSAKMSRTQQIYRQRMKASMKEQVKVKQQPPKLAFSPHPQPLNGPKSISGAEETIEQIQNEINSYTVQKAAEPSCSNENQAPRPKLITTTKPPPNVTFKQITAPGPSCSDPQKSLKLCPPRRPAKPAPLGQKLIVVSNAQTIQPSSILQKTLSIPLVKNFSVKNFDKFKLVTTSAPQLVTAANNLNSFKHKVVTMKTNASTKKVIPLSRLLGTKGGIKVLPIGGKIVGKTITTTASQPLYIVNTMGTIQNRSIISSQVCTTEAPGSPNKENGKSSVLGDILKASGVTADDFDAQIEEFRIPNNNHLCNEASERSEVGQVDAKTDDSSPNFVILEDGSDYVEQHVVEAPDGAAATQVEGADDESFGKQQVILQVQNSDNLNVAGGN